MDTLNSRKTIGQGRAKVVAVKSEESNHSVRVFHPEIGFTEFIPYVQTAGVFRVPRVGDNCYIFCDENFTEYPIAWGHLLSKDLIAQLLGERKEDITIVYSSGKDHNSIRHKIELDDGDNDGIRITTEGGNQVSLSNSGNITLRQNSGGLVTLSSNDISLSLGGSTITVGSNGISLQSSQGGKIDLTDSIISQSAGGSNLEVGSSIQGTAGDGDSKFDEISVSKHTHPTTPPGPPSPPSP